VTVTDKVARLLIETGEQVDTELDPKISVYINRLLLRLFSAPGLLNSLADVGYLHCDAEPGTVKVQLDFYRLPQEVFPDVMRLLAAPRPPQAFRYVKNGSARTGFEIRVKPDDFAGEEYDYAEAQ
jgi:hypothetical protein